MKLLTTSLCLPAQHRAIGSKAGLAAACLSIASIMAIPAHADVIPISYSLAGTAAVQSATDTTLTLEAVASGSVLSGNPDLNTVWNPITYSDLSVLDFTTGLLSGSFTLTLADGDTLIGSVFENDSAIDASPTQTGPFTQTLTFTGGTGAFTGATGTVSGEGFVGAIDFTASGSGTLNTTATPEPASFALIIGGLLVMMGASRKMVRQQR
jgi:hypothetical protein